MRGRLAGLIRFVRLIFKPEHLDEVSGDVPEPEVTQPAFLRSLAARETLGTLPPSAAGEGKPRSFFSDVFARETLPVDEPTKADADAADAAPVKKAFVRDLLARETLGEDPPADATSRKPLFLRWLFTGPELGNETDAGDEPAAPDTTRQE